MFVRQETPDILSDLLGGKPKPTEPDTELLVARHIQIDGGTQMRAKLDDDTVNEYVSVLEGMEHSEWPFPPIVTYYDGSKWWLADGFHRVAAALRLDMPTMVPSIVHRGTRRDAILHAAGANARHGLRRTTADKRRAVESLVCDEEWNKWSDREIARQCKVSADLVGAMRIELEPHLSFPTDSTKRTVTRGDQTYSQNTANIGAKAEKSAAFDRQMAEIRQANVDRPAPERPALEAAKPSPYRRRAWYPIGWDGDDQAEYDRILPFCDEHGIPDASLIKRTQVARRFATEAGMGGNNAKKEALWNLYYQLRDGNVQPATPQAVPNAPTPLSNLQMAAAERDARANAAAPADRSVDIPTNLATAGWTAVKRGDLFSASSARGDSVNGYESFRELCDEMYRIQRLANYNAADRDAAVQPAITATEPETPTDTDIAAATRPAALDEHLEWRVDGKTYLAVGDEHEPDEPITVVQSAADVDDILNPVPVSRRDGYDSNEWYTPSEYIEAARSVMGGIDLDPASCEIAQTVVKADVYLTKIENGLAQRWIRERVWLNPPYGDIEPWVAKLIAEFDDGHFVKQAIIVVNNATETGWFQSLLARFPVCALSRRIPFWRHDQSGEQARQGQVMFYLGADVDRFIEVFQALGPILRRVA